MCGAVMEFQRDRWAVSDNPRGLAGKARLLAARIFAAVNVYDALTSDRPYGAGRTRERVIEHVREQAAEHYDPRVVEVFLEMQGFPAAREAGSAR
ncbi:MAG TPA: HD domain-containing phosphohydrolase [Deinococcales bacterium]|nr:HD domain-containing phosphohydrolase [Deinococcales bacterium]